MNNPELKKKSKENWKIITCNACNGSGRIYGHGAFGESESYDCHRCNGNRIILEKK